MTNTNPVIIVCDGVVGVNVVKSNSITGVTSSLGTLSTGTTIVLESGFGLHATSGFSMITNNGL